jgi:hypothetical protein
MGTYKVKSVRRGKKYFVLGLLEQPRQDKNLFTYTGTTSPTNQPRKDPFHLYSLSPHSPKFQQSPGDSSHGMHYYPEGGPLGFFLAAVAQQRVPSMGAWPRFKPSPYTLWQAEMPA